MNYLKKTGIDKSKIGSYISGRYKAKQDVIHQLSKVLNCDPAWLIGYDVPIERTVGISTTSDNSNSAIVFIYGTIPAGVPMECIEDIIDTEEIPAYMIKCGNQFLGLKIKGN